MKKIFTSLEEKKALVFLLVSLVALTILTAVSVYEIRTEKNKSLGSVEETVEGTEELAQAQGDLQQIAQGEETEIPNAAEVGTPTLVEELAVQPSEVAQEENTEGTPVAAGQVTAMNLVFNEASRLLWPVESRNILMDYSMDSVVYYATLNQYKVSRGILIQAEPGNNVLAPADCLVTEIGINEEIGNYVVLDLGEGYSAVIGNLSGITVSQNQYLLQGTVIGAVAEPTKYYVVEGPNLYLEVRNNGEAVDPLAYLD